MKDRQFKKILKFLFLMFTVLVILINLFYYSCYELENIELIFKFGLIRNILTIIFLLILSKNTYLLIKKGNVKSGVLYILTKSAILVFVVLLILRILGNYWAISTYQDLGYLKINDNEYYEYYSDIRGGGFGGEQVVINKNIRIIQGIVIRKNIYREGIKSYRVKKAYIDNNEAIFVIETTRNGDLIFKVKTD